MQAKKPKSAMLLATVACESRQPSIHHRSENADTRQVLWPGRISRPGADFEEVLACAVCGDNGKLPFL